MGTILGAILGTVLGAILGTILGAILSTILGTILGAMLDESFHVLKDFKLFPCLILFTVQLPPALTKISCWGQ